MQLGPWPAVIENRTDPVLSPLFSPAPICDRWLKPKISVAPCLFVRVHTREMGDKREVIVPYNKGLWEDERQVGKKTEETQWWDLGLVINRITFSPIRFGYSVCREQEPSRGFASLSYLFLPFPSRRIRISHEMSHHFPICAHIFSDSFCSATLMQLIRAAYR